MLVHDLNSSIKVVTDLVSFIRGAGADWYRRSAELEKFNSNVARFEKSFQSWQTRAIKYGLSSEETVATAFHEARTLLENERARLQNLEKGHGSCCLFGYFRTLFGTAFPSQLGESIQKLLDETIPNILKEKGAGDATAEDIVKTLARKHQAIDFKRGGRYVRLPTIEQEIKNALENRGEENQSVRVVLLVGAAGTGKSCMARTLLLEYRDASSNTSLSGTSTNSVSMPESSSSGAPTPTFDEVLYVECGEKMNSIEKQKELVKLLGWERPLEDRDDTDQVKVKYVQGILKHLLQESKLLIIFDDVWDEEFVADVAALCGDRVRILITSQRLRLCDELVTEEFCRILMTITDTDAQRILKIHTGFTPEENVAAPIQDCIIDLVSQVSTNPHALASIAVAIDSQRRGQISEWQDAIHEHNTFLDVAEAKKIHGISYSSSIGVKFARLNKEELDLMVLLAMVGGPSVPEVAIQLFSTAILDQRQLTSNRSSIAFSTCRRKLEDLQCVKITELDGQFSWVIHYLDKRFVQNTMANELQAMFQLFQTLPKSPQGLETEPQEHFVKILGALYFENEQAKQIMSSLSFPVTKKTFTVAKRDAIQPILFLMMKNIWKDWSSQERAAADQMFLSYICHGVAHEEAAKILLRATISEHLRTSILLEFVRASDISLSEDVMMSLLSISGELRNLKGNQNALDINSQQCNILYNLAEAGRFVNRHSIRLSICKVTKIVLGLLQVVRSKDKQLDLREMSIRTLAWLGGGISPHAGEDRVALLVEIPMLIRELRCVLEDDTCSSLQEESAWALGIFAYYSRDYGCGAKQKIIDVAGEQLVGSLGQKSNRELQVKAAHALAWLALGGREISLQILNCTGAMNYLLDIIGSKDSNRTSNRVREAGAKALEKIIAGIFPSPEANLSMITGVTESGVSECLAGLWAQGHHISPNLEAAAARTLTRIDLAKGKSLQLSCSLAFRNRGRTLVRLGHYEDGLRDLEKATQLQDAKDLWTLSGLSYAKAKLEDWKGALKYADCAVELAYESSETSNKNPQFSLRERGVLKRMMGDLHGALEDLDESLKLISDDYEALKQRAFVKFCLGDVDGSQEDAKTALPLKPSQYDKPLYENSCLSTSTVEFLSFRL